MIYLFCALYPEAKPFLETWNLKKRKFILAISSVFL